jgi:lipopolysaccharide transport system permease protein
MCSYWKAGHALTVKKRPEQNAIMNTFTLNPMAIFAKIAQHRYLIGQLVRRDVLLKYRGSILGIGWSFLYPLLLLFTFTLIFGGVFGGRWGSGGNGMKGLELALFIYCGLAVFTPFSEVITSAPRLLLANQNFVKKIIFPTEILPLISLLSASIHGAAHLFLLILAALLVGHTHATLLLAPIALLPVWLFTLGLAWLVTAAGAYVRDLAHGMPILMQLLMFLTPVFYPIAAAPGFLRNLHAFNPLAQAMEDLRRTILMGLAPNWSHWLIMLAVCLTFAMLGYAFYNYCREEFADVL